MNTRPLPIPDESLIDLEAPSRCNTYLQWRL